MTHSAGTHTEKQIAVHPKPRNCLHGNAQQIQGFAVDQGGAVMRRKSASARKMTEPVELAARMTWLF